MDKTDLLILELLQKKARIPNVEVARTIGMAPSAVLERIRKLEASGVIQGYEVRLNPEMFQCALVAFIHVQISGPEHSVSAGQALAAMDPVQEVHFLSGGDFLLAKVRVPDPAALATLLLERIQPLAGVTGTRTHIALFTHKESARIALPEFP